MSAKHVPGEVHVGIVVAVYRALHPGVSLALNNHAYNEYE